MILYLIFAIIFCVIYYYSTRTLNYWKYKNVKGPKPIPFFGNYKEVTLRRKPKFMIFNEIYKQYPKEKVVGVYQMTSPVLLIRDLDIVKQILIRDFEVFPDRGIHYSKKGFGENMIHCDADTWRNLRNQFTVLFTGSKIKNIFHVLVDRSDRLVNYVNSVTVEHHDQDAIQIAFKYCVATTIATTYGWDVDTFNENTVWFNILDEHFINTYWQEIDLLFPDLLTKFNLSLTTAETINICHELLKMCSNQQLDSCDINISNVKNVLLNLKNDQINNKKKSVVEITDDLMAGQLWAFHMAGYINNTLTMTYAMYQLACNPNIQDTLRDEVDDVMERCGGKLTYELLKKMNYLKMVFEETLRMHPLSHVISRNVIHNVKLDGTDITIDKGSTVVISPYAIQHDENYYPEPERFNPERFSSDNFRDQHPCSFLPFGAGRRSCLASQYARYQFGVGLAKLLYHFRVETSRNTCSNLTYDPYHLLIKPEPGVQLKFVPRGR